MRTLQGVGQILWSGLKAGALGALVCGAVGVICCGAIMVGLFAFLEATSQGRLLLPDNVRLSLIAGAGLGGFFGGLAWFPVGLLRAAQRRILPVGAMTRGALIGSLVGALVVALDIVAYLYYLAITVRPRSIQLPGFLGTGGVPSHVGGLLTTDFILFATCAGFLLGMIAGSWWGTRTRRSTATNRAATAIPLRPDTGHEQHTVLKAVHS